MSYDLYLFPVPTGAHATDVYIQLSEDEEHELVAAGQSEAIAAAPRDRMQTLADLLKSVDPELEQFEADASSSSIELTHEDLKVQVTITKNMVSIAIPYFRDQPTATMDLAARCIEKLRAGAGLSAYDPQLEKVVTADDLPRMHAQYRDMDRHAPPTLSESKRPWWKFW